MLCEDVFPPRPRRGKTSGERSSSKKEIYMTKNIPSIEELMEAGVHFGHTTSRWHPKMEPFLYGKRGQIHIIDLAKTREKLEQATKFVSKMSKEGKNILWIGIKPLGRGIVKTAAQECGSPYSVNKWIGGTLTNWHAIFGMIKRMKQLEDDKAAGKLAKYTKKEQLDFTKEQKKLEDSVGGLRALTGLPDAIFMIDIMHDKTALREAKKKNIPVVAIVDSNVNPGNVDYPIPANDDAIKSISLITKVIAEAVKEGKESIGKVELKD